MPRLKNFYSCLVLLRNLKLARIRHEQKLQLSESRMAAGAKIAGLAFYVVDLGYATIYVDDRLRDLCGIPPERERGLDTMEYWME